MLIAQVLLDIRLSTGPAIRPHLRILTVGDIAVESSNYGRELRGLRLSN